jgi:hypothetical protein
LRWLYSVERLSSFARRLPRLLDWRRQSPSFFAVRPLRHISSRTTTGSTRPWMPLTSTGLPFPSLPTTVAGATSPGERALRGRHPSIKGRNRSSARRRRPPSIQPGRWKTPKAVRFHVRREATASHAIRSCTIRGGEGGSPGRSVPSPGSSSLSPFWPPPSGSRESGGVVSRTSLHFGRTFSTAPLHLGGRDGVLPPIHFPPSFPARAQVRVPLSGEERPLHRQGGGGPSCQGGHRRGSF